MEKIKLSSLNQQIISGYNIHRVKSEVKTPYYYKTITVKSMDKGNFLPWELNEAFLTKKASPEHLTQEGDIIIKILSPIEFLYITKEMEGILVPVNFYILRLTDNIVSPKYLSVYLNTQSSYLDSLCVGTSSMKKISAKQLEDIEILISTLEKQQTIEKVIELRQKEIELYELKQRFYESALHKLFSEV